MNAYLGKVTSHALYASPKLISRNCRKQKTSKIAIEGIAHIQWVAFLEPKDHRRNCMYSADKKIKNFLVTYGWAIFCWKKVPRILRKKETTCWYSDQPQFMAATIVSCLQSHPDHNYRCLSTTTFYNSLRKEMFTGITFNKNTVKMVPQIKARFIW